MGKAQLGDRTLVDVLIPVTECLEKAFNPEVAVEVGDLHINFCPLYVAISSDMFEYTLSRLLEKPVTRLPKCQQPREAAHLTLILTSSKVRQIRVRVPWYTSLRGWCLVGVLASEGLWDLYSTGMYMV